MQIEKTKKSLKERKIKYVWKKVNLNEGETYDLDLKSYKIYIYFFNFSLK